MREKFPISSDQIELLLAFERAGSLEELSDVMAKDPSVISRRLKDLASLAPVIIKVGGRWQITSLGRQLNSFHRQYLSEFQTIVPLGFSKERSTLVPNGALLIVINAQKALHFPNQGKRSNLKAEDNILTLLKFWRKRKWPVLHVKHVSDRLGSLFYRESEGAQFIQGFEPQGKEIVLEKQKASAFAKTSLEENILKLKAPAIVLVGFTAGECIDATARQASDLDIPTFVISDATATFDLIGPKGKLHKAEKVHRSVLANLHAHFADVIETASLFP